MDSFVVFCQLKRKRDEKKDNQRQDPIPVLGVGRGKSLTLPAWMSKEKETLTHDEEAPRPGLGSISSTIL